MASGTRELTVKTLELCGHRRFIDLVLRSLFDDTVNIFTQSAALKCSQFPVVPATDYPWPPAHSLAVSRPLRAGALDIAAQSCSVFGAALTDTHVSP